MAAEGQKPFISLSDKTSNGLDLYLDQSEMHKHCKLLLLQKEGLLLFLKKEGRFKFYFPSSWEGTKSARPSYGGRQGGWKGGNCFKKKKEEEDSLLLDLVWRL